MLYHLRRCETFFSDKIKNICGTSLRPIFEIILLSLGFVQSHFEVWDGFTAPCGLGKNEGIKGTGSLDDHFFWETWLTKTVLSVHVHMFLIFLCCHVKEKNKYKVSSCFSVSSIRISVPASFSLIGRFSQVYKSRIIGLLEDFLELVSDFKETA